MTAMNLYLVEARMMEDRETGSGIAAGRLRELLDEALQVLAGGLMPARRDDRDLGPAIRRDLGLD